MNKEFVTYEQAVALKQLDFDEPCLASRDMNNREGLIQMPLKQQVFRWFREKHDIFGSIDVNYIYKIYNNDELHNESNVHYSYEEAEDACIDKLIEILKSGNK